MTLMRAVVLVVGAAIFAVLTVVFTLLFVLPRQGLGTEADLSVVIGAILLVVAALFVRPATRHR